MPELNPEFAKFKKELEIVLKELTDQLKRSGLSKAQLAQIASEVDFFQELKRLGFEELVNKYFNGYDKIIAQRIAEAQAQGVAGVFKTNIDTLLQIKDLETEHLLKRADAWSTLYKSELFKSLIQGDTIPEIIQNLQGIELTDVQLGTVLNTQLSEFSRTATREVYKDKPEQRFKYVGRAGSSGIIPTNSEQCRWLMENQNPEGYTMKEIEAGIETPYVYPEYPSLGELQGTVKKIYWQGREPIFNCIHEWKAIFEEVKKEAVKETPAKNVPFEKARTTTEAEIWANKNIMESTGYVDYRGVDIDVANSFNKKIYEIQQKYNLPKLDFIDTNVPGGTLAQYQKTTINGKITRSGFNISKDFFDKLKTEGIGVDKYFEASYKNNYSQLNSYDDIALHEVNHYYYWQGLSSGEQGLINSVYNRMKDVYNLPKAIGDYGAKSSREFFAELNVAKHNGRLLEDIFPSQNIYLDKGLTKELKSIWELLL